MAVRFKIADLMALVFFGALGALCVRLDALWLAATVVYLAAICAATVAGRARRAGRRAPWTAFALFGWAWLTAFLVVCATESPRAFDDGIMPIFAASGLAGASLCAYAAGRLAPGEGPSAGAGTGAESTPSDR